MDVVELDRTMVDELLGICRRNLTLDLLSSDLLSEKIWGDTHYEPGHCLGIRMNGCFAGFGIGVVRGNRGFIKCMVVDRPLQNQGLGGALLDRLEQALISSAATTIKLGESVPNYLWPGIDKGYSQAIGFFEKRGYKAFSQSVNMRVDLHTAAHRLRTEVLTPVGVDVRRACINDGEQILAFIDRIWPSWRAEVTKSLSNEPISLHLALHRSEVVGFAAYDTNNIGTGWFGPMGTSASFRKQGIGGILLKACLADIQAQGHHYATIPWVGPVKFYQEQVGAVTDRQFIRYQKKVNN